VVVFWVLIASLSVATGSHAETDFCSQYLQQQKYDDAIIECSRQVSGVVKTLNISDSYLYRGLAYEAKEQFDKAIADFSKAIEINPNSEKAYDSRGNMYLLKGQADQAIADYSKVIALNPKNSEAYINRARGFQSERQFDQAIADYSKIVELNPKNSKAFFYRGLAYASQAKLDLAIVDFKMTVELNPKESSAYYNLACIYSVQNNITESCAWLDRALANGYDKWEHVKNDPDLFNVRDSVCYFIIMKDK